MKNTTIHLERQTGFFGSLRAYRIFLDGKKINIIHELESRTFEVQPGTHKIFLKVDYLSSPHLTLHIEAGEEIKLICKGHGLGALLWPYFMTFGYRRCIKLYREQEHSSTPLPENG